MVIWGAIVLLALSGLCSGQRKLNRQSPVTAEVKTGVNFDCPEEFGYYPHPTDCTQYYVCVFGGALLESCTGGLMYSHELQTCDWPRNVGCDSSGEVSVPATASPAPSSRASPENTNRVRYTPPPSPPAPPQPTPVVTSRGQPRQLHHNQEIIKQQQQLYEDAEEVLPPAEEIESDRQQRVYRGQPSTVGQVQRDRDGLRHSNAIPNYNNGREKIGVISFGTQQQSQQQQPVQQYRVEITTQPPTVATATARNHYNGSHFDTSNYDPYYSLYEDDVELYRDVDYAQQYNINNNAQTQQTYRGTPAPTIPVPATQEEPKRDNSYNYNTQDVYQQPAVSDYNEDNSFNSDVSDNSYRQSSRQPARTNTRGRGSAHYTASNSVANVADNTVNRGTPPSRSRPTLKPSTSIVSKAAEFVDIYRFPPRRPEAIYPQPQPDKTAAKCRKDVCLLPDCSCGGKEIPGNIPVEQVPQIVLLTFDDSVNDLNKGLYSDLFEKGRVNPNGCPITATFYVSHEWTDYSQVQNLYADGHEMASHTVS